MVRFRSIFFFFVDGFQQLRRNNVNGIYVLTKKIVWELCGLLLFLRRERARVMQKMQISFFFTSCFGYSREIVTLFKKLSHFAYFCVFDVFTFIYSFNLFVDFLPVLFSALSKFWMLHIWTFEYESTSEYNTISPNWLQAK